MSSVLCGEFLFFFFKQKTAYEMRISDWSSDVCSSDLSGDGQRQQYIVDGFAVVQQMHILQDDADGTPQVRGCTSRHFIDSMAVHVDRAPAGWLQSAYQLDRKSTRLNSSH